MNKGVRKSANDVIKGIRKLFGSVPRLKREIALKNNRINIMKKIMMIVRIMIKIITNGLTSSTPVIIPIENPVMIKKTRLIKRVNRRP